MSRRLARIPEKELKEISNTTEAITIINARVFQRMRVEKDWNPLEHKDEIEEIGNQIINETNIRFTVNEFDDLINYISLVLSYKNRVSKETIERETIKSQEIVKSKSIVEQAEEIKNRDSFIRKLMLQQLLTEPSTIIEKCKLIQNNVDVINESIIIAAIKHFDVGTYGADPSNKEDEKIKKWDRYYNGRKIYAKPRGEFLDSKIELWGNIEYLVRALQYCDVYHRNDCLDKLLDSMHFEKNPATFDENSINNLVSYVDQYDRCYGN